MSWLTLFASPKPASAIGKPDEMRRDVAKTGVALTEAKETIAVLRRQLGHAEADRDAARIERDTAQRERDGYRDDALKFRQLKSNLIPGGPKAKAKREANGASAQAVV